MTVEGETRLMTLMITSVEEEGLEDRDRSVPSGDSRHCYRWLCR